MFTSCIISLLDKTSVSQIPYNTIGQSVDYHKALVIQKL